MRVRQLLVLPIMLMTGLAQAGTDPAVVDWSKTILEHQPEKVLSRVYGQLSDESKKAGRNLLGNASATVLHENGQILGREQVSNWEVGVSFPLKALDQRQVYGAVAEAYGKLAQAQRDFLAWQSRGIARQLLNTVVEKAIYASHDINRLEQAQRLYDLVRHQVKAGARSQLDLALARQRLSQVQAEKAASEAALAAALAQLAAWGVHLEQSDLKALVEAMPVPTDLSDKASIISRHPQIRWLEAQRALSEAESSKEVWNERNSVEVYTGVIRESAQGTPDDTLITAELSIPLGKAPGYQLAKAQARLIRQQANAQVAVARRDIRQALIAAEAELLKAQAQVKPAADQLKAAEAALQLSEQAWRQGEISLRDLILAQQARLDAALQVALVHFAVQKAVRNLNQQAGE